MTCERDFPCGGVLETREARVPGAVSHARTQVVARAGPSRVRCLSPPRCVSPRRLRSARIARRSRVHHHPSFGAIRLTERSTALFILLRHAQAAAARVAPRNGLSSRRRVATGTVALRAQPRSRTVARSAPYTPLKINAVRQRLVKPKTALGVTRRAPGECGEKSAAFFRAKRAHATTLRSRRDRFERSRSRPTLPSHAASLFSVPSRH